MKVLLAYDGSAHADAAINDLTVAGLPDRATALVLSVVDAWLPEEAPAGGKTERSDPVLMDSRAAVARRVEAHREIAELGAARLRSNLPNWRVTADACADSPAAAIIRRAEGENGGVDGSGGPADLTVVGSRGLGPIKRLILGSVAQKVMHGLRGSIRIARERVASGPNLPTEGTGASPPAGPPRIVLGVDGSADSDAAVVAVAARHWPKGTQLLIACYAQGIQGLEHSNAAWHAGLGDGGIWSGDVLDGGASAAGVGGTVDSWATRTAARAAGMIRGCCPGVSVSSVVRLADPSYALVQEAANWGGGADCIFVGARGVRGLERFLLGSVSTTVAMNAHCSVEIVHRRTPRGTPEP